MRIREVSSTPHPQQFSVHPQREAPVNISRNDSSPATDANANANAVPNGDIENTVAHPSEITRSLMYAPIAGSSSTRNTAATTPPSLPRDPCLPSATTHLILQAPPVTAPPTAANSITPASAHIRTAYSFCHPSNDSASCINAPSLPNRNPIPPPHSTYETTSSRKLSQREHQHAHALDCRPDQKVNLRP
jgi:hypothetical protein